MDRRVTSPYPPLSCESLMDTLCTGTVINVTCDISIFLRAEAERIGRQLPWRCFEFLQAKVNVTSRSLTVLSTRRVMSVLSPQFTAKLICEIMRKDHKQGSAWKLNLF